LTLATSAYKVSGASAQVLVDPPTSIVSVGGVFNVNINVSDIANFTCWQLRLFYLNSVLNCSAVAEGPFLKTAGGTYFDKNINNEYNSTYGCILAYCTLLGMTSANGNGVLATFTFKALAGGNTPLHLVDIILGDEKIPPQPIPYTVTDGMVNATGADHDVAVTSVASNKTVVGKGDSNKITITVENHGRFTETFNITLSANTTVIATQELDNMFNGTSTILTFTWNTSGFAYGNYTISANADIVPSETNTADNIFYSWIIITIPGDISGDFTVNILDAITLANSFAATPNSPQWNPNADINDDGVVNILDAIILSNHFLQHYP
jgi:hypothetical protein